MSASGRRPMAGMERTPSGAISRSKSSIAKRAEKLREAQKDQAKREARIGRSLQERTQQARAAFHGIDAKHAASHHASSIEGRLYLKRIITATELLAVEHYKRTLARFARDAGGPAVSANPLAKYVADEPRAVASPPSGAAASLAARHYDAAEETLRRAGRVDETHVAWAVSRVCRHGEDLPARCLPAFIAGVRALVAHYSLGPDPDRNERQAA